MAGIPPYAAHVPNAMMMSHWRRISSAIFKCCSFLMPPLMSPTPAFGIWMPPSPPLQPRYLWSIRMGMWRISNLSNRLRDPPPVFRRDISHPEQPLRASEHSFKDIGSLAFRTNLSVFAEPGRPDRPQGLICFPYYCCEAFGFGRGTPYKPETFRLQSHEG